MIRLAYGRMLRDALDGEHGLPREQLGDLARRFTAVREEVQSRRAAGEYGFYGLVDQGPTVRAIKTFAATAQQPSHAKNGIYWSRSRSSRRKRIVGS